MCENWFYVTKLNISSDLVDMHEEVFSENECFPCFFVHSTTPHLIGLTSQTTAQNTSPDSVECAKIGLAPRNLTYPVACLIFCHENV